MNWVKSKLIYFFMGWRVVWRGVGCGYLAYLSICI